MCIRDSASARGADGEDDGGEVDDARPPDAPSLSREASERVAATGRVAAIAAATSAGGGRVAATAAAAALALVISPKAAHRHAVAPPTPTRSDALSPLSREVAKHDPQKKATFWEPATPGA